jgi:hypothetical protein
MQEKVDVRSDIALWDSLHDESGSNFGLWLANIALSAPRNKKVSPKRARKKKQRKKTIALRNGSDMQRARAAKGEDWNNTLHNISHNKQIYRKN